MLYTMVVDYRGGTYVAQVESENPKAALVEWASTLSPGIIKGLGDTRKMELMKNIFNPIDPVPLDGVVYVWCTSVTISGGALLINIVATNGEA